MKINTTHQKSRKQFQKQTKIYPPKIAIFCLIIFCTQILRADCICVCENGRGKALCESRYENKNCSLTKCPPALPNTPNPYYQPHSPQGYYYNPTPPQPYYNPYPPHPHYPPPYPHYPPPR